MKRKVLTVCNGGNVRSTMLAEVLKGQFNCEAIASSTYWLSHETMTMLCHWADIIAPVEPYDAILPVRDLALWKGQVIWFPEFAGKLRVAKIGPDIWGHAKPEELKAICKIAAVELLA